MKNLFTHRKPLREKSFNTKFVQQTPAFAGMTHSAYYFYLQSLVVTQYTISALGYANWIISAGYHASIARQYRTPISPANTGIRSHKINRPKTFHDLKKNFSTRATFLLSIKSSNGTFFTGSKPEFTSILEFLILKEQSVQS